MEKIQKDLQAALDAFAREETKTPHLAVATSLVASAAQRLAAHLVEVEQIAAAKQAVASPGTAGVSPAPEKAAPAPKS